jgi:hypothetical protein
MIDMDNIRFNKDLIDFLLKISEEEMEQLILKMIFDARSDGYMVEELLKWLRKDSARDKV